MRMFRTVVAGLVALGAIVPAIPARGVTDTPDAVKRPVASTTGRAWPHPEPHPAPIDRRIIPRKATTVVSPTSGAAWQSMMGSLPIFGDGMISTRIDTSRVAFLTGDAVPREPHNGGSNWAHSSITIVNTATGASHVVQGGNPNGAGALPYQMIPDDSDGTYHWLGPAFVANGKLYSLAPHNRVASEWPFFEPIGTDWAQFSVTGEPTFLGVTPWDSATSDSPRTWGASVWYDTVTRYVYIFGVSRLATDGWTGHDVYISRVPLASLTQRTALRYWSGSAWVVDETQSSPIMTAPLNGGTDTAFSAWHDAAGWHVTSRYGGPWGQQYAARWSSPTLNPSDWTVVQVLNLPNDAYLVMEHWTVGLVDGTRLLTFNQQGQEATWATVQP